MSAYLARLKQLDGENSHHAHEGEPTKPSKDPFVGFDGRGMGHIAKKFPNNGSLKKPDPMLEQQREARRQKVTAMLEAKPVTKRAIYVDDESDPHNVILAVGVRCPTAATCEMRIPRARYDAWLLLDLVERHGQTTH